MNISGFTEHIDSLFDVWHSRVKHGLDNSFVNFKLRFDGRVIHLLTTFLWIKLKMT
jgi:hypothetical protein